MNRKNAFNLPRYEIEDIFKDEVVVKTLKLVLSDWLDYLDVNQFKANEIIDQTFNSIKEYGTKTGFLDETLRQKYSEEGIIDKIKEKLKGRAEHIYNLIHPFLGNNILDQGCGDGSISKLIHNKKNVNLKLSDVVDVEKRRIEVSELPFYIRNAGTKLQFENGEFDTSLLITVLHHSEAPLFELDEVIRVTNGNIILIESVYGICLGDSSSDFLRSHNTHGHFHSLTCEQQRMYGTFMDWFLNKLILGNEINCPYNFNTPENWEKIFAEKGLKIEYKQILGIDQMVTPEYHILYVVSTHDKN